MTTATFDHLSHPTTTRADRARHEMHAQRAALSAILAKHDDRLLRDVGLMREGLLGPAETFWADWRRTRETWSL